MSLRSLAATPRVVRLSALLLWLTTGGLAGCGDEPGPSDAGADGSADAATDGATEGGVALPELPVTAAVEAIRDRRGFWHVYAENDHDAFVVVGYLMARDRLPQMEMLRRVARGELAERFGALEPGLVEDDRAMRVIGHRRNAEAIWAALDEESRAALQAYADGVNVYLRAVRNGSERLPPAVTTIFNLGGGLALFRDWDPVDTLALARFMSAALAYDADEEVGNTQKLQDWAEAFPADADDPRRARLAGAFHDLYPFEPARKVWVLDGFPNLDVDGGTRARRGRGALAGDGRGGSVRPPRLPHVPERVLQGARRTLRRIERIHARWFGEALLRGSNSWAVSGEHTASGHPILANDPHLSLPSPPLFWHVQVTVQPPGATEPTMEVQGLALTGTPMPLLGYNRHIAWGLTTHGYDVSDAYLEQLVGSDAVRFEGSDVPLETVTETIQVAGGDPVVLELKRVPHHGVVLPESVDGDRAISLKWPGDTPSFEVRAFLKMARARSVEEARVAFRDFRVGGQTLVVVDREGHVFYTSYCWIPVRDPRALTYDPSTGEGVAPAFVMDGASGEYEWIGELDPRYIPHVLDPARGFVATANGDAVGVTGDGNPFDAPHYIGYSFAHGYRIGRITERLEELVAAGGVTPEDMQALQADAQSPYGRFLRDGIVEQLDRALQELGSPGTHPDLGNALEGVDASEQALLATARDLLRDWSLDTPAAVEGSPSADELRDSAASSLFNVAYGHLMRLALGDELTAHGHRSRAQVRTLQRMVRAPETLVSYDEALGDTVLWDDITTDTVESRGDRIVRAVRAALAWLRGEEGFGTDDPMQWRWGKLHTLRLQTIVPQPGVDRLSIPTPDDPDFPDGFPRHGDRDVVDASGFSAFALDRFSYGGGPQQRLVVEMTPSGPRVWNALPGGQVLDPASPHHADEMDYWRRNEAPAVAFDRADVEANAEERLRFEPPAGG